MVTTVSVEQPQKKYGDEFLKVMSDRGFFVFPTHDEEWSHNKSKLLEVNKLFPVAKLTSVGKGSHSKSGESEKAGGLLNTLYICKGSKVMLSVNLCVRYGLFNGAIGIVEYFFFILVKEDHLHFLMLSWYIYQAIVVPLFYHLTQNLFP